LERLADWFSGEYPGLLRFAYFLTGDRSEAEDLVQETFSHLLRARARLGDGNVSAYARQTLMNLKRSAWRRLVREHEALRRVEVVRAAGDPASSVGDQEVRRSFLALPVKQRACIALRFYEDMKEQQISDVLGISLSAVKKNVERGLANLRRALEKT
jgi:RNA polymerase sigma-70 factor (ECF subfamily)